ncbi:Arylsulfatase [hydrothermal vent metagenome]|uniref:Arylsulfatase n=1 Tax=hydrothermal vent metagenome TaxID=652676 RepID=A0A3B1DUC2_9ZZZZ
MRLRLLTPCLFLLSCLGNSLFAADVQGKSDDSKKQQKKNVILFVVDDQGMQAGCYGNKVIKTPGIDQLAASGTRYTRAHCTTASCSASRSVLLTGLYNHATGHYGHSHNFHHFSTFETVKTLPVILEESGYRTCSIGKYHVAPEYIYHFQQYRNKGIQGNRNSARMAKNAKEFITEKSDKPFFLYYCSSDPHRGVGKDLFSNFNENPKHYPGVTPVKYKPEDVKVPRWMNDNIETRKELAQYYQAISRMDQGVVSLIKTLKETGHWDDTLIIFCSDNGPPFPGAKTCLYQPGMNLPLIVRNPDTQKQGGTSDAVVMWSDILPTILDYCKVTPQPAIPIVRKENSGKPLTKYRKLKPQPVTFHGRSFLKTMGVEHPENWDENFASHTFHEVTMYYPMRVIVSGKYKYIFNIAHQLPYPFASDLYSSPTWQSVLKKKSKIYGKRTVYAYLHRQRHELYNLEADPDEIKNLATDPKFQKKLQELQTKLKAWQKKTKDPWISKWEYE